MGWDVPVFGHIPLIHGADGAKLSKRHGALGVDAYKDMGFMAEAMINYLARLGWSHGDDEIFSLEQAASWFDGSHIGKSPARFDLDKLNSVNQHWMRALSDEELAQRLLTFQDAKPVAQTKAWLIAMMPLFTQRAQNLAELARMSTWLFHEGRPELDEQAKAVLTDEAINRLQDFSTFFQTAPEDRENFDTAFQNWMDKSGLKMKDIGLPLRAALTGTKNAPSIIDIVLALGKKEVQNRLQDICF